LASGSNRSLLIMNESVWLYPTNNDMFFFSEFPKVTDNFLEIQILYDKYVILSSTCFQYDKTLWSMKL